MYWRRLSPTYTNVSGFGIVEDLENSFEMLRYQTGLNVTIEHRNVNSEDYPKPSKVQREKLKALMPMDYYLYEYAKQLHEYRYKMFTELKRKRQQPQIHYKEIALHLPEVLDGCMGVGRLFQCHLFGRLFGS